jgi:hypothetical protein
MRAVAVSLAALALIFFSMPWWKLEWTSIFVALVRSTL